MGFSSYLRTTVLGALIASVSLPATVLAAPRSDECPPVPAMSSEMGIVTRYKGPSADSTFSTLDAAKVEQQKPVRDVLNRPVMQLNRLADSYGRAPRDRRGGIAHCISRLLDQMAQKKFLTGTTTKEDYYYRDWLMVAITTSMLALDDVDLDGAISAATRQWLSETLRASDAFYESQPVDNHLYWHGLSMMLGGVLLQDRARVRLGESILDRGIKGIGADGHLQAELARGKRALHYHLFAAIPLAAMAEIAGSPAQTPALRRLVDTTLADMSRPDGGEIGRKSGDQLPSDAIRGLRVVANFVPESGVSHDYFVKTLPEEAKGFFFLGGDVQRFGRVVSKARSIWTAMP